jgi:pilus assembly protein Flp/PilA
MLTFVVLLQERLGRLLRRDDRGVTAVEYGLIVFFIALVIIAAVTLLGTTLSNIFTEIQTKLTGGG